MCRGDTCYACKPGCVDQHFSTAGLARVEKEAKVKSYMVIGFRSRLSDAAFSFVIHTYIWIDRSSHRYTHK